MDSSRKKYIMIVLASAGLVAIALSIGVNVSGLFISYLVRDFELGRGIVSFSITAYSITMAFSGLLVIKAVEGYGYKKVTAAAIAVNVICTAALSLCKGIVPVIAINIIRGFCGGMSGMVLASSTINYWFHENTALMTSIVLSFSGITSALLSPVISSILSAYGWQKGYLFVAAVVLVLSLPALLFPVTFKPELCGMLPYGSQSDKKQKTSSSSALGYVDPVINAILIVYVTCSASLPALPSHFTGLAESYGLEAVGALMVSSCMISNTVGKIIMGSMLDRMGSKISLTVYIFLIISGISIMYVSRSLSLLIAGSFLYGFCYSINTIAITFIIREMFGVELFSKVYPTLSMIVSLSSAIFTTVVGYLYDLFKTYSVVLIMLGCIIFTGWLMIMLSHARFRKLCSQKTD
ncbi:MAG: MFS transporter [Erysipelotrichaceae bacterium]|nr:MFS transporter [Erysipelotrichaceae bacterium]